MSTQTQFALSRRNPDVLTCIANLSNDEVFTPPELAKRMLDTLAAAWAADHAGAHLWADKNVRFLDPCTKSGVFLREITRRLTEGLAEQIPDLETRVNHILTQQVFGIGITHLTSLLARRSVYCSKHAQGQHSIVKGFASDQGHIWFQRMEHTWANSRCTFCGASQKAFDRGEGLETHAYAFIHTDDIQTRMAELFGDDMQFDVIIGNPPYQIEADDSGQNIIPIYNKFVDQAKALAPRYITMIIPSRWMAGGKWLDAFRSEMLHDTNIRTVVDYPNAAEAFPGVDIKGGVCYFLWNRDEKGHCTVTTNRDNSSIGPTDRRLDEFDVFVRDSRALDILRRVLSISEASFFDLVSPRDPFGSILSSNFKDYHSKKKEGDLRLYINQAERRGETWVNASTVTKNHFLIDTWKVLIPKAGPGNSGGHIIPDMVLSKPLIAEPGSVCTLSYLTVGPLDSQAACVSVASYLRTRFVRFLISLRKPSQDAPRGVYSWVPRQSWDRQWTDEMLYEKYGITSDEIAFIESMIRPMDSNHD
ncbi:MAG: Eco57I restriction-modification methylase domain-containing protein [Caldilineales bacterium]